jgi:hypothetical protein
MKIAIAFAVFLFLQATPSWAVLGQPVASVRSDQQRMRGEIRSASYKGYSVQQITAPDGGIVKEYVSAGTVFAVTWQSRTMPNLQQLLGSYFTQFQQTSQAGTRRRRGGLILRTNQLVVESGGHMRAFHGRAYIPSLVPSNVPLTAIQ